MLRVDVSAKQFVTIDGQRIAYLTAGDPAAPPLLLVHGLISHAGVWRQTIDALKDSYYCIAPDLLGLANSDKPANGDYSIPAQAKRVLAVADKLGLQKFTLAGHSMGGQISLYIASTLAPERVTRLIDVAGVSTGKLAKHLTSILIPRMRLAVGRPWLWTVSRWSTAFYPMARWEFSTWFHHFQAMPYEDWAIDRAMAMQSSMHTSALRCAEAIGVCDLSAGLNKITCPTLIVFGDDDAVVPVSEGETAHRLIPGSQLAVFEHCGHFPMYEKTGQYVETLRGFLGAANGHGVKS